MKIANKFNKNARQRCKLGNASGNITYLILALMVVLLILFAINNYKKVSVGKAYEVALKGEDAGKEVEISLLANMPAPVLLNIDAPVKKALFDFHGSAFELNISLGSNTLYFGNGNLSDKVFVINSFEGINEKEMQTPDSISIQIPKGASVARAFLKVEEKANDSDFAGEITGNVVDETSNYTNASGDAAIINETAAGNQTPSLEPLNESANIENATQGNTTTNTTSEANETASLNLTNQTNLINESKVQITAVTINGRKISLGKVDISEFINTDCEDASCKISLQFDSDPKTELLLSGLEISYTLKVKDFSAQINGFCKSYPCYAIINITSARDGALTLSDFDIVTEPVKSQQKYETENNVFVMEDDGTLALNSKDPAILTKKFYDEHPDKDIYDFIGFHFKNGVLGGATYSYKVKDSAQQGDFGGKVGDFTSLPNGSIANRTEIFGSKSRLLGGYVDSFVFNEQWVDEVEVNNDPISAIDDFYFGLLFHELTHYWGVALPEELKEALVYDGTNFLQSHWEFFTGSWVSVRPTTRLKFIESNDSKLPYKIEIDCSSEPKQHDFDLYSMGLKSENEVVEKLVVTNNSGQIPGFIICDTAIEVPDNFIRKAFTIHDVIKALGQRVPSEKASQKNFSIAFVMVVPKGETLDKKQVDALNWIADKFPVAWYKSTDKRSILNNIAPIDLNPPSISEVKTSAKDSSIRVEWLTNEPATSFVIYTQQNADTNSIFYADSMKNPPEYSTMHKVIIQSSEFTPILPDSSYGVKIISIDENYNLASFDAGIVKTQKLSDTSKNQSCKTSLDCPVYNKCEDGMCVDFCGKKTDEGGGGGGGGGKGNSPASLDSGIIAKLTKMGYSVAGNADLSGFTVKTSDNKIMFSSKTQTHTFDQSFDSFILTDEKGNKANVQKTSGGARNSAANKDSYIIELKEKPLVEAKAEIEKKFLQDYKKESNPKNIRERVIEELKSQGQRLTQARQKAMEEIEKASPKVKIINSYKNVFNGFSADIPQEKVSEIKLLPSVKNVHKNEEVKIVLEESVNQIDADEIWKLTDKHGNNITGEGIKIAIIDTGVDYKHKDLGGCFGKDCKVAGGYDFINKDDDPMDDLGHGTHVAAAAAGDGTLKGVAPKAKIYAYKALDSSGSGSFSDIISAIERAVDPNEDGDFSDHLNIISMSLGGFGDPDDALSKAVDNAVDAGVVVTVAAGNSGPGIGTIGSPGTARKAITVGAVDKCDSIAEFSSRGPVSWDKGVLLKPDLTAPGVSICAAEWDSWLSEKRCKDDRHIAIAGTSMATPHVAGAAALLLQENRDWTPEVVKSALMSTASDLDLKPIEQGTGRIDVLKAIKAQVATMPASISFEIGPGNGTHKETVTVKNLLNDVINVELEIEELKDDKGNQHDFASLSASKLTIDVNSSQSFDFIVGQGEEGTFTGKISIKNKKEEYIVPFIFERLSRLTVKAVASGYEQKLKPGFMIHNEDLSFVKSASNGFDFEGDNFTFKVPGGTYTAYAIGEFGSVFEYILSEMVDVPKSSESELELSFAKARPFTVKAESLDAKPLKLYQWSKGFNAYNDNKLVSNFHHDPLIGNQSIYLSNKPNNKIDTDIVVYFQGVPAREEDIKLSLVAK